MSERQVIVYLDDPYQTVTYNWSLSEAEIKLVYHAYQSDQDMKKVYEYLENLK